MTQPTPERASRRWLTGVRLHKAAWVFGASVVSMAILGAAAVILREPWVFPSLGPTAFLLFFAPGGPQSGARNVIAGHGIGVAAGVLALAMFGLLHTPVDLEDLSWQRAAAAVTCVGVTLGAMVLLNVPHAPAGATTLIVGLGLMTTIGELTVLMLAVITLTLIAFVLNRYIGPVVLGGARQSGT